jgi:hypothetical protein
MRRAVWRGFIIRQKAGGKRQEAGGRRQKEEFF